MHMCTLSFIPLGQASKPTKFFFTCIPDSATGRSTDGRERSYPTYTPTQGGLMAIGSPVRVRRVEDRPGARVEAVAGPSLPHAAAGRRRRHTLAGGEAMLRRRSSAAVKGTPTAGEPDADPANSGGRGHNCSPGGGGLSGGSSGQRSSGGRDGPPAAVMLSPGMAVAPGGIGAIKFKVRKGRENDPCQPPPAPPSDKDVSLARYSDTACF